MISKITQSFWFRLFVGCGILYLLSLTIDLSESWSMIRNASKANLALALVVIAVIRILLAWRWKFILDYDRIAYDFKKIFAITYISTSLGQIMPGGIGPDMLRIYQLKKDKINTVDTASSIIYDRAIGILSMLVLAFCGSLVATVMGSDLLIPILLMAAILLLFAGFIFLRFFSNIRYSGKTKRFGKLIHKFQILLESLTDLSKLKKIIFPLFGLSVAVQVLRCVLFFLIYLAMGASVGFIYFMIFIPIVLGISVLPLSIGGLGVREGLLAFFFAGMHLKPEISVSAGLMFQLLQILFSLPGIVYWISKKDRREPQVHEPN